jgi:Flp pilus assembly protein TadB
MSKERARRRAEERARRRAPKKPAATAATGGEAVRRAERKAPTRSARERRRRNRIVAVASVWLAANAVIFMLADTWNARWLGLTITTILVPVVVWLLWDPEGRVDL